MSDTVVEYVYFPATPTTLAYVYRASDDAFIPIDLSNADYQKYLAWVANGNQDPPPDAP